MVALQMPRVREALGQVVLPGFELVLISKSTDRARPPLSSDLPGSDGALLCSRETSDC